MGALYVIGSRVRGIGAIVRPVVPPAHECRNRQPTDAQEEHRQDCATNLQQDSILYATTTCSDNLICIEDYVLSAGW